MRGPEPMDPERRAKLGNPGKRGHSRPPDGGVDKIPPAPRTLGPLGEREWKRLWTAGAEWLDVGCDLGSMTRLCEAYERREVYRAEVMSNYLVKGSKGQVRVNPAASELRAIDALLTTWEAKLGFSLSERGRLRLRLRKPDSKLDVFTKRRQERHPH